MDRGRWEMKREWWSMDKEVLVSLGDEEGLVAHDRTTERSRLLA
jgi:hypothetical protein